MGKYILKRLYYAYFYYFSVIHNLYHYAFLPTSYVETQARQLASLPGRKAIANGWSS